VGGYLNILEILSDYVTKSVDPKTNYLMPSIDGLFETAADSYGSKLIGVILADPNNDGSKGLKRIKEGKTYCARS